MVVADDLFLFSLLSSLGKKTAIRRAKRGSKREGEREGEGASMTWLNGADRSARRTQISSASRKTGRRVVVAVAVAVVATPNRTSKSVFASQSAHSKLFC